MNEFKINGDHITISQLLKVLDYVVSGGETKYFLLENECLLNESPIYEKNKKIRVGDIVTINGKRFIMI